MLALALLAVSAAPPITTDEVKLLGGYLTTALAADARVDVISAEEVRRAMEFEAEKQAAGCASSSCLAEIAGALGADAVAFGEIGALGERLVLNVSLFDAKQGSMAGRLVIEGAKLDEIAGQLREGATRILDRYMAVSTKRAGKPALPKVVVLDLLARGALGAGAPATKPAATAPSPAAWPLLIAGGAGALVGLGMFGASNLVDNAGKLPETPQTELPALEQVRDFLGVGGLVVAGAGVVVTGVGGALLLDGGAP